MQLPPVNLVRMQSYPESPVDRLDWKDEQETIAALIREGKNRGVEVRSVNRQHAALRLATHYAPRLHAGPTTAFTSRSTEQ